MNKKVIVIGGGIAGMEAAYSLSSLGIETVLIEKENTIGGHVAHWDRLFPNRRQSTEVLVPLKDQLKDHVTVLTGSGVSNITRNEKAFHVTLKDGKDLSGDAILLATGFEIFNARKKEEYGFGIYDNVITSAELEDFFQKNRKPDMFEGFKVNRVGIVHCVGSRDEKVGNLYCSKVCCVTGVKQAIEIKELIPDSEIFCFYMDLRMFDRHFEELYYEAQQKWGIQFIRGRVSEAFENPDHTVLVKVEDTLTGLPMKLTVDLMILLAGFVPSPETKRLAAMAGIPEGDDGFLVPVDEHLSPNQTSAEGVFITGAVRGPISVAGTLADAKAAALAVKTYLDAGN